MTSIHAPHDEISDNKSLLLLGRIQLFTRVLTNITTESEVTNIPNFGVKLSHKMAIELEDLRADFMNHKTTWFDAIFCDMAERRRINEGSCPFCFAALVLCTIQLEQLVLLPQLERKEQNQVMLCEHIPIGLTINERCTLIYATHWLTIEMKKSFLQYSSRWNLAVASAYDQIGDIGSHEERIQQAQKLTEEFEILSLRTTPDQSIPVCT